MFSPLQNMSGLLTKERLYLTSAEIATINEGMDDNVESAYFSSLKIIVSYMI